MDEQNNNEDEKRIDNIGKATGFFLFRNLVNGHLIGKLAFDENPCNKENF